MMQSTLIRGLVPLVAAGLLTGCNALTRITQIGETPPLTTIQDPRQQPGYRPVSLPMPAPMVAERRPNSLWQTGSRAFFKDQRANQPGDILTVEVSFDNKAQFDNNTQGQRNTQEQDGANILGLKWLGALGAATGATASNNLFNINGTTNNQAIAEIKREEQVTVNVAAMVTQVLPNGDLVVVGTQEMRVNNEVRNLQVTGVVRQQDISSTNTVTLDKLAEARISYGGQGVITNIQQPRYGEQLLDVIAPF
ncbi:MAG TPA: flagellar basal body L-ring protein FlgH [Stellaceae bacterium]|nr:flagellar basal body L-ring protein FlgH [Stellaceae bacterium]